MAKAAILSVSALILGAVCGCPGLGPTPGNTGDGGTTGGDTSADALSYRGQVSGTVSLESTSTEANGAASRKTDLRALISPATAWFTTVDGDTLLDEQGNPYPTFQIGTDGSFSAGELPVGVDLVLNVDIDGDGTADLQTVFSIAADPTSGDQSGEQTGVVCDPLSTLALAKLQEAFSSGGGGGAGKAPLSLFALLQRTRAAFAQLFENGGLEVVITLSDLLGGGNRADLFDRLVPESARRGMEMAGKAALLSSATDIDGVMQAVCPILLKGGFAIVQYEGSQTSVEFLEGLEGVESISVEEFFALVERGSDDRFEDDDNSQSDPIGDDFGGELPAGTVYFASLSESNRNFPGSDEGQTVRGGPLLSSDALAELADMYLQEKTVSFEQVYTLITDPATGLGARLTYRPLGAPGAARLPRFVTEDGAGFAVNLGQFLARVRDLGLSSPLPGPFRAQLGELRRAIKTLLQETRTPPIELLWGELLDFQGSADQFTDVLVSSRAHLPFSRTGPSELWVLANRNSPTDADPITVDVTLGPDSEISSVEYNTAGNGAYWLQHGPRERDGFFVHFVSTTTGRLLRIADGRPALGNLEDEEVLGEVGSASFFDAFVKTETVYPGGPLNVPNPDFDPTQPPSPESNPPTIIVFVLQDQPAPRGEPVRVQWSDGAATLAEDGYYLWLTPEASTDGVFTLLTTDGKPLEQIPGDPTTVVTVDISTIEGLDAEPREFTWVPGVAVENPGYDPDGAPFYDDFDNDDVQDADEPSFDARDFLRTPGDWRSTFVERFYRRSDNNQPVSSEDVDWSAGTPQTTDGVPLTPRNIKARLNAYRFNRPLVAGDLLLTFSPAELLNGETAWRSDTRMNPFQALALASLAFDSVINVEVTYDPDGEGPRSEQSALIAADLFVPPIGDPFLLLVDGFGELATTTP